MKASCYSLGGSNNKHWQTLPPMFTVVKDLSKNLCVRQQGLAEAVAVRLPLSERENCSHKRARPPCSWRKWGTIAEAKEQHIMYNNVMI